MQDHTTEQELKERLSLIESMVAEGRRNTESWGWTFVLWALLTISLLPGLHGITACGRGRSLSRSRSLLPSLLLQ